MVKYEILNRGLLGLTDAEFKAYYYIANAMGKTNKWKRLNHTIIGESIGKSSRQVLRITDALHKKGYIYKDTKYSKLDGKSYSVFKLNFDICDAIDDEFEDTDGQENDQTSDTGVIHEKTKKIKELKNIKNNKSIKEDKQLFEEEMLSCYRVINNKI